MYEVCSVVLGFEKDVIVSELDEHCGERNAYRGVLLSRNNKELLSRINRAYQRRVTYEGAWEVDPRVAHEGRMSGNLGRSAERREGHLIKAARLQHANFTAITNTHIGQTVQFQHPPTHYLLDLGSVVATLTVHDGKLRL
jgi:hypothetical protein